MILEITLTLGRSRFRFGESSDNVAQLSELLADLRFRTQVTLNEIAESENYRFLSAPFVVPALAGIPQIHLPAATDLPDKREHSLSGVRRKYLFGRPTSQEPFQSIPLCCG